MLSESRYEYVCEQCKKRYSEFNQLQIHMKHKHKEIKHQNRSSLKEQQIYEFEDKLFTFLGELSELYTENIRPTTESESILDEPRFIGQANYLPNSIVRTPYEIQINVTAQIPQNYQFHPNIQIVLTDQQIGDIVNQINLDLHVLSQKLQQERPAWEFADPHDTTINFQDQFSVLDVAKLIKNYYSRNLGLKIPQLSLFLVWIARVLKAQMFKLMYEMLVSQTICFENYLKREDMKRSDGKVLKHWERFVNLQRSSKDQQQINQQLQQNRNTSWRFKNFKISLNVKRIKGRKLQKIMQFYDMWVQLVMSTIAIKTKKTSQEQKARRKVEN